MQFLHNLRFDLSPWDGLKKDKSIHKCSHLLLAVEYARIPGGCFLCRAPDVIIHSLLSRLLTVQKMQVTLMRIMRKRKENLKELTPESAWLVRVNIEILGNPWDSFCTPVCRG